MHYLRKKKKGKRKRSMLAMEVAKEVFGYLDFLLKKNTFWYEIQGVFNGVRSKLGTFTN